MNCFLRLYYPLTRREKYRLIDPSLYAIKLRKAGFNLVGAGIG